LETIEALQARHAERVAKAERAGERPPKPPRFEMVTERLARGETATFASALCYHGPRPERFVEVFAAYGKIELNSLKRDIALSSTPIWVRPLALALTVDGEEVAV
jgi:hypothetical protein